MVPARRSRKKRRTGASVSELVATMPGQIWRVPVGRDFLEERTLAGGRVRVLCISDEFTRQSLAIVARTSFRSERVCGVLEKLCSRQGIPKMLRHPQDAADGSAQRAPGPELIALALRGLCHRQGINPAYIEH